MAKAKKPSTKKAAVKNDSTVVRISASDDAPKKQKAPAKVVSSTKKLKRAPAAPTTKKRGPLAAFIGYFKGAWYELKQVRWPTRRATWGLTLAVLLFSAFFVVFILLIDAGFKY